jgi:hypothetical protein
VPFYGTSTKKKRREKSCRKFAGPLPRVIFRAKLERIEFAELSARRLRFLRWVAAKPKNALAALALGAAEEPHSEIRLELPPTFRPHVEAIRLALHAMGAENHAGALALVAGIRLDDIAALRSGLASREINHEPHEAFSGNRVRPRLLMAMRWRSAFVSSL